MRLHLSLTSSFTIMKYRLSLASFLFMLLVIACTSKEVAPVEEVLRPVRYAKIVNEANAAQQTFSGSAQSGKESSLSFRVGGTITQLAVKVGDRVRKGQLISALDATDYSIQLDESAAQLQSAESQIKSAESQMLNARSNYRRIEQLYENNSVPLSEFEQAKTNFEAAQSSHEAALAQRSLSQKQMQAARNQVSYARLLAPYEGIITQVVVEENEQLSPGSPVALISSIGEPEVQVGIPESFIARVKKGQRVSVSFSALPDQTFTGQVSEVGFSTAGGATYPVTVGFETESKEVRPGMAARVTFLSQETDETDKSYKIAPVKGVSEGRDGRFVFVLKPVGDAYQVEKRPVKIGKLLATGFEVMEGLQEGELIATAGLSALLDGMKVVLLEE